MQITWKCGKGNVPSGPDAKVYDHQGGTQTPLDHDTELQPCIRKAPAIFQIECT